MINWIKLWILGATACVAGGWILSALHQVNPGGYIVFFVIFGAVTMLYRRDGGSDWRLEKLAFWKLRRFHHSLPLLFLLTAMLAAIGGAAHAPNNYDALTYRFPRVLHWWAASGWQWIATPNERMNLAGTAFEWMMMPIFVLTHGDRLFFLINIAAYLLMPSLIFLTFTAAGVRRRVARFWMWLLPAALCYAMQAGSISNDTIAATYFLAAIYFALRARQTGEIRNLWFALLAAGLLTGVKGSNLPLALPTAAALCLAWRLAVRHFASTVPVVVLSMLVSFLPTAALNAHYTGDWAGDPQNLERNKVEKPLAGILGNSLQLALQSLEPPFLPLARNAENWVWNHFPARLQATLKANFPRFVVGFRELPQEESAGVGIGITVMAAISIAAAWRFRGRKEMRASDPPHQSGLLLGILTWVALFAYMTKLGSESTSRLVSAYYPMLLLPFLFSPAQGFLVRRRWYQVLACCVGGIALVAVVLTPSRPLWPAETFFDWAARANPRSSLIYRARMVFAIYRSRSDIFAPLRRNIPDSVPVIGVIAGSDDAETSLWRPFGMRRVVEVTDVNHIHDASLQWLAVKDNIIAEKDPDAFNAWLRQIGGAVVARQPITEKASAGPEQWSVVRLSKPAY